MIAFFVAVMTLCTPPTINAPHGWMMLDRDEWRMYMVVPIRCAGEA